MGRVSPGWVELKNLWVRAMSIENDPDYLRLVQRIRTLTDQGNLPPDLEAELDTLLGDLYEFELIHNGNPEDEAVWLQMQQLLTGLTNEGLD